MFSDACVGDTIYSMEHGPVRIVEIQQEEPYYPIKVELGPLKEYVWITVDGKANVAFPMPTFFWSKPGIIIPPKPLPKLAVDTPVLVRDPDTAWIPAHFAEWGGARRIRTWVGGRTSHTSQAMQSWLEWKLPD